MSTVRETRAVYPESSRTVNRGPLSDRHPPRYIVYRGGIRAYPQQVHGVLPVVRRDPYPAR
jgi:hypothetical protein